MNDLMDDESPNIASPNRHTYTSGAMISLPTLNTKKELDIRKRSKSLSKCLSSVFPNYFR